MDSIDPNRSEYRVRVTKDYLQFCAAHSIVQEDLSFEPLHGHNYRVAVTLWGTLNKNARYVIDFVSVKTLMRRLVNTLDHRVLLAEQNPYMSIDVSENEIQVILANGNRYLFPRRDVVLLPVPNTTAEMLATYLAARIRAELPFAQHLTAIEVEVEETPGQSAFYTECWNAAE